MNDEAAVAPADRLAMLALILAAGRLPKGATPTELVKAHRLARMFFDAPVHPHVRMADLDPDFQGTIGKEIHAAMVKRDREGRKLNDSQVYLLVLDLWGVDCPHRMPVGGGRVVHDGKRVETCIHCGTVVVTPVRSGDGDRGGDGGRAGEG